MWNLTTRILSLTNKLNKPLNRRRRHDDRGAITAEYLMWGAVAAVAVVALGSRLFNDVLNSVIDTIQNALP